MRALERLWWRGEEPRFAELYLWPLTLASQLYRAGAAIARGRAQPARAALPTILVGNLTVGGAGKTPVTLALAQRLQARGLRVAILSRGHGRRSSLPIEVQPGTPVELCGDEPLLLRKRLPDALVLVGPRRALLAGRAAQLGAQVLLLDDGLQHHALARDLDVVVVDASNPLGNGKLLPRGPLRELPQALERTRGRALIWLTRLADESNRAPLPDALAPLAGWPLVRSTFTPAAGAPELSGRRVFLFAGIARPDSFEVLAVKLGATVIGRRWFGDHHWFSAAEAAWLIRAAADALLLTTEKDLVRWPPGAGATPVALPVDLKVFGGEEALQTALDAVLR